jgi:hypothetical protein
VEIKEHSAEEEGLLNIFLAEVGACGLRNGRFSLKPDEWRTEVSRTYLNEIEELNDDCSNTSEESWSRDAFHDLLQTLDFEERASLLRNVRRDSARVKRRDGR